MCMSCHLSQGNTPLHIAARYSSDDACCKLLLDHNAEVEAKNDKVSITWVLYDRNDIVSVAVCDVVINFRIILNSYSFK